MPLLSGIRVVEVSQWIMGPMAAMLLGDLGAEVIKIEPPDTGDPIRNTTFLWGLDLTARAGGEPLKLAYESFNYNKKSVALDVTTPEGLALLHPLLEKADVLLIVLHPKQIQKLKLDYDSLKDRFPRLVYALGTGWGSRGPDGSAPGQDTTAHARAGSLFLTDPDEPKYITGAMADTLTATMLAQGTVAALYERERTGRGQMVEASLFGSLLWLQYWNLFMTLVKGDSFDHYNRATQSNPLMNFYRCADNQWLCFGTPSATADKNWPDFARLLGAPELADDPRFTTYQARLKNSRELIEIIDHLIAKRPRAEWIARLQESASKMVWAPINHIYDIKDDEQARANDYITSYEHPSLGTIGLPGSPVYFSNTGPPKRALAPPELGQHTTEVLTGLCNCSPSQIKMLEGKNIIKIYREEK